MMNASRAAGAKPVWLDRMLGVAVPAVGLIGLVIAEIIQFSQHGTADWDQQLLINAVTYLIGVNSFATGIGHNFFGDPIARSIGWQPGSPFQFEVGLANLAIGIPAFFASSHGHEYWLPIIATFAIFYLGAAIGHVRDMIRSRNFAPGNAGPIFYYDILAPVGIIVLYLVTR